MYKVIFKNTDGQQCGQWETFASITEARSAILDADLIIPMTWTFEIRAI